MSAALAWSNLLSYCLQIGLLIGVAAVVPGLFRMHLPKVRLAYWYALLVTCLILPQTRPWQRTMIAVSAPAVTAPSHPVSNSTPARPAPARTPSSLAEFGLYFLAAGAAVRLIWMAVGLVRLRRYRRNSHLLVNDFAVLGRRPEYRLSSEIGSPVTFGLFEPVILLPSSFAGLSPSMQLAVLCHETLHVERRDWAFTVVEEFIRAIFWFHPAIWWLLGEIQLSREQAVDREVVERTSRREEYVDTLLAVAGQKIETDLALAPLFLKKRHLRKRVVTILKESAMSKTRVVGTLAAGLLVLAGVSWFVGAAFPLMAEPQVVQDGPNITVNTGGLEVMHRGTLGYPMEAISKGVKGDIVVQVRLGTDGSVLYATVESGPDELRKTVLQSVLNWHFSRSAGAGIHRITISFQLPDRPLNISNQRATLPAGGPTFVVRGIQVRGLSDQSKRDLLSTLPVHEGDAVSNETMQKVRDAVLAFDEHLTTSWRITKEGERQLEIFAPGSIVGEQAMTTTTGNAVTQKLTVIPPPPQPAAATQDGVEPPKRMTVGGNVMAASLVYGPKPEYPALAKQARISGVVHLHALIAADGTIQSLSVIPPAHPLLATAALEGVKQWRYKVTMLNYVPVEVETTIDVTFSIAEQ